MADRYSRKLLVPPFGSTRLSYRGTEGALGPHFLSVSEGRPAVALGPGRRGRDGTAFKRQGAGVKRQ